MRRLLLASLLFVGACQCGGPGVDQRPPLPDGTPTFPSDDVDGGAQVSTDGGLLELQGHDAGAADAGAATDVDAGHAVNDPDAGRTTDADAGNTATVDAGSGPTPDAGQVCAVGDVSGRVCATDSSTWLNAAAVTVQGTDCNGQPFLVSTTTAADGSFTLASVPAGARTVHAQLGSFTQDTPVTVLAGQSVAIPSNQLCLAQKALKIAVITGVGDHLETLLTGLNLTYDTYDGMSGWATSGATLLADLAKMKQYDLIFIDCGAAKTAAGSTIDLGANSATIAQNVHDYVLAGGSIYASDWALVFPVLAFPGVFTFHLNTASSVSSPFEAHQLMGYAPQTIASSITDAPLATFVGKTSMQVSFPMQTNALSLHWGLLSSVGRGVEVLMSAPTATACWTTSLTCSQAGATEHQVPLAVRYKATPAAQKGGWLLYTAFHNIAQPSTDVSQVLKYLTLNL